jgi:membrane protease subunit (stomatin/prohibitin family)
MVLAVALAGLGIAAGLAALAIAVIAVLSVRAFLRLRKGPVPANDAEPHDAAADDGSDDEADPSTPHYSCENCGTTVRSDATECPKCGTHFA